ncbi:MAG TPA: tetratricopeptide repeat protein [Methylomirabilota bacterium]|jgi:regulator of sirC expression with transglutaminase-like and TPR domain|nr:tetratricopeptide repeat protein [Methylomirabilota bacterium]
MDPGARFARLAQAGEGEVRLGEAALWIAADEYPHLDLPAWLGRLDALGTVAARRITPAMDADATAGVLNALLFEEQGFRGNRQDYYDPRNSFLSDVLERRLGIPITLAVVYMEVGAAAGVTVRGVGLPGHFVVRLDRHGTERVLDPFDGGARLGEADCRALLRRVYDADVPLDPAWLRPVSTQQIVSRMLANLKGVYMSLGDWTRALRTVERMLAVAPGALGELRDRGTIRARLGDAHAAIRDWETYLVAAPDAHDADRVRQNLRALRQAVAVLN